MGKIKSVAWIVGGVVMLYVILGVFMVFISDQTVVTNQALDAAHNMTQYPGTSGFLLSIPWILYIVPAAIGIIWIIVILKRPEST